MLSMTGYGRGQAALGSATYVVELRAVNHRYLDLRVRTDPELAGESRARTRAQAHHSRAHRRLGAARRQLGGALLIDRSRARAVFAELRALRDELAPYEPLPLTLLSSLPTLFSETGAPSSELRLAAAEHAVRAACDDLNQMRAAEGLALQRDLDQRGPTHCRAIRSLATADQSALIRAKLLTCIHVTGRDDRCPLDPAGWAGGARGRSRRCVRGTTRMRSHLAQVRALWRARRSRSAASSVSAAGTGARSNTIGSRSPRCVPPRTAQVRPPNGARAGAERAVSVDFPVDDLLLLIISSPSGRKTRWLDLLTYFPAPPFHTTALGRTSATAGLPLVDRARFDDCCGAFIEWAEVHSNPRHPLAEIERARSERRQGVARSTSTTRARDSRGLPDAVRLRPAPVDGRAQRRLRGRASDDRRRSNGGSTMRAPRSNITGCSTTWS
jgi:hypothetical protein